LTLLPYHSQNLNLASQASNLGLKNFNGSFNLILDVQGKAGGILLSGGSVDQTNTYVFEVSPHGIGESAAKSLSYWSTKNGDDTMVTLWNPADEAQDLVFRLFFTGGQYQYAIHLEPRATHQFNVSEIVQNQIPDAEGHIVPATVHEGSAEISGARGENESILVAIDGGTYNVRKATCSETCTTCGGEVGGGGAIVDDPFAVAVGGTHQLSFHVTWNGGVVYDYTSTATWTSKATSIGTVSEGVVSGVAAGALGITALQDNVPQYRYSCQASSNTPPPACLVLPAGGSSSGTVGPDHLSVAVDNEGFPATCPTTGVYLRQMEMQVVDAQKGAVTNNPAVAESYSNVTTNTCGNGQPVASSCAEADSGQFIDSMTVSQNLCNSGIKQSSGCGYSLTSTWSACGTSGTKTLWVSPRVTLSNSVKVDGSLAQWPKGTQCTSSGC
jgi:hypothetical protein